MSDEALLDQIPLSALQSRYGLGRTAVYSRIQALKLQPLRQGKKAFITQPQLDLLDQLHEYLSRGDSMAEAIAKISPSPKTTFADTMFSELFSEQVYLKKKDLLALMQSLVNQQTTDPLAPQRALEEAYQHGWEISTSQLAQILGIKAKNLSRHESLCRYGFIITKCGRLGTEIAWKVSKKEINSQTR